MDRLRHGQLARVLIGRCGGLEAAASVDGCRVGKSQLADYASAHGESVMPADIIFALEAYCGEPLYSRALYEGHAERARAASLVAAAMEASEDAALLQRDIRLAADGGALTPAMRRKLASEQVEAEAAVHQVGLLLAEGAGSAKG